MLGSGFSTSKSVQLCNVTCKMLSTVGHALFLKDLLYDINIRVIKSTLGKSLFLRSVHSTLKRQHPNKPSSVCHYVNQRIKDRENHSLLLTRSLYNFNKHQCIVFPTVMQCFKV